MADPVASVEKIVKLGLAIKKAADTVRRNEEECHEIRKRVLRFSAILSQLQQTGMMNNNPAMSAALEDLEETLERALELVTACQERSTIRRFIAAGDLSKHLQRVKDDILNKVMLASFAINTHTTIVLLTIQAGGVHPPPRLQQDTGVVEITQNSHSTDDARSEVDGERNNILGERVASFAPLVALKKFNLSELKAAINDGNLIGRGSACEVYKGVLNDGNVVAIKKFKRSHYLGWARTYDQLLLVSKLRHKNIVKVLGYGHEAAGSFSVMRLFKGKEKEYIWVEEYMSNGSLGKIIRESRLDWSSLFRIIEGVAQGVQYLHEQHVVHMDVKPANIILDYDMNPKITDFEFSEVLDDDEITHYAVIGTVGHIPPEYMMESIVSRKNDVYAFGITLLETVSIMCISKPPRNKWVFLRFWNVWEAGRMEELFDPSLFDGSQLMEINRCVKVGLLCTESDRADRPSMADVLEMLNGKKELPTPKKPHYTIEERIVQPQMRL
ncbi:cysteine-rich receptor-like protein kinase 10 [Phragmites australis]|uniref:cysteine-rich receptor-like protein kinase 10 n=1 Tax=Phragmites australis TaxID=29695 RepID=UPI002D76D0A0|nr:cysteine-rich receptor-like protein kinase 10 [Phragmites australis]XP_062197132.1 cysteine-rich receptor-like protein kinase 10 [Phragmites australis]XP_062197133.1 cysteine-rich receptor-like protein kinase 10 [Phragmites australis]XP_062197134.1 cysteine-rich receptor-like protein kinase 10 [Phragmites australis]XP_062197135.1 cysteine-rich receptor-like protein kinase 10 [Phragmites australis]